MPQNVRTLNSFLRNECNIDSFRGSSPVLHIVVGRGLPGAAGRPPRGLRGSSDYVRLAIDVARQHLGGFGVAGELRSGFEREFAAGAIADAVSYTHLTLPTI